MDVTEHEGSRRVAVDRWHDVVAAGDESLLDALVADEIVFRSPAVHRPQVGRAMALPYLAAALVVLGPTLQYRREWVTGSSAVLEFTAEIDGLEAHGIDLLTWDERDRLVEFTVMVRPLKALNRLVERMGEQLQKVAR